MFTWGDASFGGDASALRDELVEIQELRATRSAFCARSQKGHVVAGHSMMTRDFMVTFSAILANMPWLISDNLISI